MTLLLVMGNCLLLTNCKEATKEIAKPDIVISGSETEFPLISSFAEEFENANKLSISVSGGGSNTGMRDLMKGEIDIANSSRVISESEMNTLKEKNVKWAQVIVGSDAIAIVTNRAFQIGSLSLSQLSAIFSGKVSNWKDVGGPDRPIHSYGRNFNSGTHDYMKHRLNINNFKSAMNEYETYAEIIANVKKDKGAIGYVSLSCLEKNVPKKYETIHIVNVLLETENDFSPFDEEAINSGEYPLIRPLFQYYDAANTNSWIKKFIEFETSEKATALLKQNGYFPINVFHKQINSVKASL